MPNDPDEPPKEKPPRKRAPVRHQTIWKQIAARAIHTAEQVECPLDEFAIGLAVVEALIRERRRAAHIALGWEIDREA